MIWTSVYVEMQTIIITIIIDKRRDRERARERKMKQIFKLKCSMTHNYQKAAQSEIHS